MALTTDEKWSCGIAFGVVGVVFGMAWYGSKGEVHVPPPPPDRDPRKDFQLQELELLESRMRRLRGDPRGYARPIAAMRDMKTAYVNLYRTIFGEEPRQDDLKNLTGGF